MARPCTRTSSYSISGCMVRSSGCGFALPGIATVWPASYYVSHQANSRRHAVRAADGPCDGENTTIPGGAGTSAVYDGQLKQIAAKLKAYAAADKAKLLFALTTPMLNSGPVDALVQSLNAQASATMAAQSIPTVDLHKAVIQKCGKAPQAGCFGSTGCFSPHCPGNGGEGYYWLVNTTIAPAMRKLL